MDRDKAKLPVKKPMIHSQIHIKFFDTEKTLPVAEEWNNYAHSIKKGGMTYEKLKDGSGVRGVVPQKLLVPEGEAQTVQIMFRPAGVYQNATVRVMDGEREVMKQKKMIFTPGEMAELNLKPEMIKGLSGGDVTIRIDQ